MTHREGLLARLDDRINPIVVKEMRQAVNGKFVAWTLVLLLVFQLVALGLFVISGGDFSTRTTGGRDAFLILQAIMLGACLLFVPAYAGGRLAFERSDANVDLLFITTIKPVAIVGGKVFCALAITTLIFSACMPFMVFTYWLRGIDLPSIFVMMAICFIEVAVAINMATLIACLPSGRVIKILLSIVLLFAFMVCFSITVGMSYQLASSGIGSKLHKWQFWEPALTVLLISGVVIGLLFSASTALLTPISANRALPVRVFITATWIAGGAISAVVCYADHSRVPLEVWGLLSAIVFAAALFVAVSEREALGSRVALAIPRNPFRRLLAFFFFSGAASGVTWAVASSMLTYAVFEILPRPFSVRSGASNGVRVWIIGLPLYAFCYSMTAVWLRRKLFSRRIGQRHTWALGLILLCIGSIVPFLVGFLAFFGNWGKIEEIGAWFVFNPFALGIDKFRTVYLTVAFIWALLAAAMNASWIGNQIEPFRAPDRVETLSL